MNILTSLPKTTTKSSKRVGRGIGSGVGGHTTGRGAKGDKVRGTNKLTFDGTKIKKGWIKRTPFLKGKHRVLAQKKATIVKLDLIAKHFENNSVVDSALITKTLKLSGPYKILAASTEFSKALTIKGIKLTKKAQSQISQAGGIIEA